VPSLVKAHSPLRLLRVGRIPQQRDPLVDLDDLRVEDLGLLDGEVEDLGAGLVADLEEVAEAFGDEEGVAGALALEEGVGRYRGRESVWPLRSGAMTARD
jgi:hypothetical protein